MTKEHLYKAKRKDWKELPKEEWWVEGFYVQLPKPSLGATILAGGDLCAEDVSDYIIVNKSKQHSNFSNAYPLEVVECEQYEVEPKTVCKYIGLPDKNGEKIFENDIVRTYSEYREEWDFGVVKYGEFNCSCCSGVYGWHFGDGDIRNYEQYEVRGNIFDNPELLKGGGAE